MHESIQAGNFLIVTIKFLYLCSVQGYPGHQLLLHLPLKKKASGQTASSGRLKRSAQEGKAITLAKDLLEAHLQPIVLEMRSETDFQGGK